MVRAVLPPERSTEALVQRVLARAAGNPLFLEELAQAVREQGTWASTPRCPRPSRRCWPHASTASPEAKHLLHTAAVLGTEVSVPLLAAIAELQEAALHRSLAHLQAAEFLYETRLVPERVYTKHTLTHEVAYDSLLLERRRLLHARIVEALEALAPERGAGAGRTPGAPRPARRGVGQGRDLLPAGRPRAWDHAAFREAMTSFEQALQASRTCPTATPRRWLSSSTSLWESR